MLSSTLKIVVIQIFQKMQLCNVVSRLEYLCSLSMRFPLLDSLLTRSRNKITRFPYQQQQVNTHPRLVFLHIPF